jgi:Zn-dependent membrane protease YugP
MIFLRYGYGYGYGGYGYSSSGSGIGTASMLLYILFIAVALYSVYAQFKVSSTFNKYSKIRNVKGYTGADVARLLLEQSGIHDVNVEPVKGNLTDHYDPTNKVLRLSESVYGSASVAALGVAAHETGHAVQHHTGYAPLTMRSNIFPVVSLSSKLAMPLIIIGLLFGYGTGSLLLAQIGVVLFSLVVLFQLITLPVEFDASSRALKMLQGYGFLTQEEMKPARKVLWAAAMTYVAAAATSIIQLLRLILIVSGGRRRD